MLYHGFNVQESRLFDPTANTCSPPKRYHSTHLYPDLTLTLSVILVRGKWPYKRTEADVNVRQWRDLTEDDGQSLGRLAFSTRRTAVLRLQVAHAIQVHMTARYKQ